MPYILERGSENIMDIVFVVLLTLTTGMGGLAIGGSLALLVRQESPRITSALPGFTAGLMLCIVCFDMIPEAMEAAGTYYLPPIFLAAGFLITVMLNGWIEHHMNHEGQRHHSHGCNHHNMQVAGVILATAVAVHNFPIGLVIGTSVAIEGINSTSLLAALTIGLHNIPEGMSIAVPFLNGGSKARSAIGIASLSGLPTVIGALTGYLVGNMTQIALAVAMSLAGGAMLYVTFFELLPDAYRHGRTKWATFAIVLGFVVGIFFLVGNGHMHVHVH